MSAQTLDYLGVGDFLRFSVPSYLDRETAHLMALANGNSTLLSRSAAGYAYVTELFSTILASTDTLSTRVLRLLEQRYAEPLTLYNIADEFHTDRFALCRAYKQERGVTVMEDLNRIRIAKAKRFLKYGADPIEKVGRMCGFDSPSYFGKRFRESVGQTPAEYRKKSN
jgi:YesN/AraC family two-component response regulator